MSNSAAGSNTPERTPVARRRAVSPWLLPLAAALLPALGTLIALLLYRDAQGASCNAFVDDCVSISRMAREGLANHLFRALVLPGAVLQGLTWLVAAERLAATGVSRGSVSLLRGLGLAAAVTLVVYASFLGSDGVAYRVLRRWGPLPYFGGTYLAMLVFLRCTHDLPHGHALALSPRLARAMTGLLAFIALIALCHGFASVGPFPGLEDRVENLSEWWGALALMLTFVVMGLAWRRWGLAVWVVHGADSR